MSSSTDTGMPALALAAALKCDLCKASKCCTYVTQAIDAPRSKHDFDHLLWQVSHEHVGLYKDEDGWYLLFDTRCTHLQPDGRCGIYEHRPQVCRDHTNDYCEYDAPAEEAFDLWFPDYASLLTYCRTRFKTWGR